MYRMRYISADDAGGVSVVFRCCRCLFPGSVVVVFSSSMSASARARFSREDLPLLRRWVRACALPGRGRRISWYCSPVLWHRRASHGPCEEIQPCNQDAPYCCCLRSGPATVSGKAWNLGAVVTICAWRSECGHRRPTRGRVARLRDHVLAKW